MQQRDFEEIEQTVVKRFEESLIGADPKLSVAIAKISARIATMAIQEYHRKLQQNIDDQSN